MVGRGGAMVMVMVMVMVAVVVAAVRAEGDTCSTMKVLGTCKTDEGPREPGDGQTVYLKHPQKRGNWFYPKYNGHISYWRHPIRTITDTKWAKWIWRDCGDGYVCLESVRYPHYYLGVPYKNAYKKIYYSTSPSYDDKLKMKPHYHGTSRPAYVHLDFKEFKPYKPLYAYLYIPPRCEGYKQVAEYRNPGSRPYNYKYTFEKGVTQSESRSETTSFSIGITAEVTKGIGRAAASGSFSKTWTHEISTSSMIKDRHEVSIQVPPRKHMVVWQKVAKYGNYEIRSSTFIPCEKNI